MEGNVENEQKKNYLGIYDIPLIICSNALESTWLQKLLLRNQSDAVLRQEVSFIKKVCHGNPFSYEQSEG